MKTFCELLEKTLEITKDIPRYTNLDTLDTLTALVEKLPYNLRGRWVKRSVEIEKTRGFVTEFSDLVEFVKQESDVANSLFGLRTLNDKSNPKSKPSSSKATVAFLEEENKRTGLGSCWLAFGRKTSLSEVPVKVLRANVEDKQSKTLSLQQAIDRKDAEIAELRSVVKDLSVEDEIPQWSRTDIIASQLVEPCIKVKDDQFEIPVPVVEKATLPNNFELAHERLSALQKKALRQPDLKAFLVESMAEMESNNYIERVPNADCANDQKWYLPYFVTSQVKKRIVYDGKSKFKGTCVNDIIMSGPDLLNPLLHVLTRFRLGKYALMSDVTKCFFQVQLPAAQRDLFYLLWFENNDVERGKLVSYCFQVHPWGIKSSPYIACLAFKKLVEENPTWASNMTLQNILQNMYMDDLIFSVDSLESAQTITNEAVSLFKSRGFKLVKWSANRDTMSVLLSLGPELLSASIQELDLCGEELALPSAKTLGCVWDPDSDELRIDCSLKPIGKYTRRTMLSQLGQNFDPLGFGSLSLLKHI